jgi:hypothetical protein
MLIILFIGLAVFAPPSYAQECGETKNYDEEKRWELFYQMVNKAAYVGVVKVLEANPINKSAYELKLQPVYPYTVNTNQDIYVRHYFSNLQKSAYTDVGTFHEVIIFSTETFGALEMASRCAYLGNEKFFTQLRNSRKKDLRKRDFLQAKTACYNKGGKWTIENNVYFCKKKASK